MLIHTHGLVDVGQRNLIASFLLLFFLARTACEAACQRVIIICCCLQNAEGPNPAAGVQQVMQQYTRLALLTIEVVTALGVPTDKELQPPDFVGGRTGYVDVFWQSPNINTYKPLSGPTPVRQNSPSAGVALAAGLQAVVAAAAEEARAASDDLAAAAAVSSSGAPQEVAATAARAAAAAAMLATAAAKASAASAQLTAAAAEAAAAGSGGAEAGPGSTGGGSEPASVGGASAQGPGAFVPENLPPGAPNSRAIALEMLIAFMGAVVGSRFCMKASETRRKTLLASAHAVGYLPF